MSRDTQEGQVNATMQLNLTFLAPVGAIQRHISNLVSLDSVISAGTATLAGLLESARHGSLVVCGITEEGTHQELRDPAEEQLNFRQVSG